jgi:hypothetical protein
LAVIQDGLAAESVGLFVVGVKRLVNNVPAFFASASGQQP